MADLDDFFAKKDRVRKTKGKKKTSSLEEPAETDAAAPVVDNSEWKEFTDKKARDYSGLKVASLSVAAEEEKEKVDAAAPAAAVDTDDADDVVDADAKVAAEAAAGAEGGRRLNEMAFPTLAAAAQTKMSERESREFQEVKTKAGGPQWRSEPTAGKYQPPAMRDNRFNALNRS
jgi:hypothetical protein